MYSILQASPVFEAGPKKIATLIFRDGTLTRFDRLTDGVKDGKVTYSDSDLVYVMDWGQPLEHPIYFDASWLGFMATDLQGTGQHIETVGDYIAYQKSVGSTDEKADAVYWWLTWLQGDRLYINNGKITTHVSGIKSALHEKFRLCDLRRFLYLKKTAQRHGVFANGNYDSWEFAYNNDPQFKAAADMVTTWAVNDKGSIKAKKADPLFVPQCAEFAPVARTQESIKTLFPSFPLDAELRAWDLVGAAFPEFNTALNSYKLFAYGSTSLRNVGFYTYPDLNAKTEREKVQAQAATAYRYAMLNSWPFAKAAYYMARYPKLSGLPSPPWYGTDPLQRGVNSLNMRVYLGAIMEAGEALDAGTDKEQLQINLGYFPKQQPTYAESEGFEKVLDITAAVMLAVVAVGAVGAATGGAWSASAAISNFSITEATKTFIVSNVLGAIGAEVEKAINEAATADAEEEIEENQQAAAEVAAQAQAEAQAIAEYERQTQLAQESDNSQQLLKSGGRAIIALITTIALVKLGG